MSVLMFRSLSPLLLVSLIPFTALQANDSKGQGTGNPTAVTVAPSPAPLSTKGRGDGGEGWVTTPSGLRYTITKSGVGQRAKKGQYIVYRHIGRREDGSIFEDTRSAPDAPAAKAGVPPLLISLGLQEALELLRVGDYATIIVPPHIGYGDSDFDFQKIPANSTVQFEVEVTAIKKDRLIDLMIETISEGGLAAAKALWERSRANNFRDVYFLRLDLSYVGRGYLYRSNRFDVATALLEWNVERYSGESSVHRDLADAYFVTGNRDRALHHYELAQRLQLESAAAFAKKVAALKTDDQRSMELERSLMFLTSAPGFGDKFAEVPINIDCLRAELDRGLAAAAAVNSAEAATLVEKFLRALDAENTRQKEAIYKNVLDSPITETHRVVAVDKEISRQLARMRERLSGKFNKPLELKFISLDGREVDFAKFRGKVVLLQIWTTWSRSSKRAIRQVLPVYSKYHAEGFEVVGISLDRSPEGADPKQVAAKRVRSAEEVRAFTDEIGIPWPQYYDGEGWNNRFGNEYFVEGVPMMLLFDQSGVLVDTVDGSDLSQKVEELLKRG